MYEVINSVDSGRVIAVWSYIHRQGASSTVASLLSAYFSATANEDEGKLLLISNELGGFYTAANYLIDENISGGLIEVCELAMSDNLKSCEDIYNNSYSGLHRIDILNSIKRNNNVKDNLHREIPKIFDVARQGYKYTLVDCAAGLGVPSTLAILKHCDTIIVCMPQDRQMLDRWVKKLPGTYTKEVETKPTTYVSSIHYEYSHMTLGSIQKKLKTDVKYISMNDLVHKAISNRSILQMINSEIKSKKPDDVIEEIEAIKIKILNDLEDVVEEEIKVAIQKEEENKRQALSHLNDIQNMFDSDMYNSDDSDSYSDGDSDEQGK